MIHSKYFILGLLFITSIFSCGEPDFDANANDEIHGKWKVVVLKTERNGTDLTHLLGDLSQVEFIKTGTYTGSLNWSIQVDTFLYKLSGTYRIMDHALDLIVNDSLTFGLGGVPYYDELEIGPPYLHMEDHYYFEATR